MADSPPRARYSKSPPPRHPRSRSRSPPPRRDEASNANPGNNLYITGLSTRVTEEQLRDHFLKEGKVTECRLVKDPRTHESRGFGFVTMAEVEDAEYAVRNLHKSTLEGRVIMVEKAKRKRARTPTPGQYMGVRAAMQERTGGGGRHGDDRYGGGGRDRYDDHRYSSRRSPEYAPYRGSSGGAYGGRDRSPGRYDRDRSPPYRSSRRSRSPEPRGRY